MTNPGKVFLKIFLTCQVSQRLCSQTTITHYHKSSFVDLFAYTTTLLCFCNGVEIFGDSEQGRSKIVLRLRKAMRTQNSVAAFLSQMIKTYINTMQKFNPISQFSQSEFGAKLLSRRIETQQL